MDTQIQVLMFQTGVLFSRQKCQLQINQFCEPLVRCQYKTRFFFRLHQHVSRLYYPEWLEICSSY